MKLSLGDAKAAVEKIQAEEPMKFHFETEYEAKVSLEKLVAVNFIGRQL